MIHHVMCICICVYIYTHIYAHIYVYMYVDTSGLKVKVGRLDVRGAPESLQTFCSRDLFEPI